jgi:hypothetical protein
MNCEGLHAVSIVVQDGLSMVLVQDARQIRTVSSVELQKTRQAKCQAFRLLTCGRLLQAQVRDLRRRAGCTVLIERYVVRMVHACWL